MVKKHNKIFVLCLMVAMCVSILPLFTSALEAFELGKTYQYTPPGDVSTIYQANGTFLGEIYFEGLEYLNDLEVHSVDVSFQILNDADPSNITYESAFGVICSGIYPTGEDGIPVYYDVLFYQVSQDTIFITDSSSTYIVQVATLVEEEVVMLDNYNAKIDKILFTPMGFADETIPVNYSYLVSWFTEESIYNNEYLPFVQDYLSDIKTFTDAVVTEITELFNNNTFWSIVLTVFGVSLAGSLLSSLTRFFRR